MDVNDVSQGFEEIKIDGIDRWQIYFRLQELDIPCHCTSHEPLKVLIKNANSATQVWSVTRHIAMQRQELVQWLENCFTLTWH